MSLGEPVKNSFSVPYSLMDFMDTSFFGFQSSMFWRSMSQVEVFKVRVPDVGHFIPPGETDSGNFPPASILWLQGWVSYRDFVSASSNDLFIFYLLMILVWAFLFHLVYGIHPASFPISFRRSLSV